MRYIRLIALLAVLVILGLTATPQGIETANTKTGNRIPLAGSDSLVDFVSDTQSPLFIETLRLSTNNNEHARALIFDALLADHPSAIVHLGDIVSLGFYVRAWTDFDEFMRRARAERIPIYPTVGNHELLFFSSSGMQNFYDRFPWYPKTGYVARIGRVATILLNSNLSHLTDEEQRFQQTWFGDTLRGLDADSTIEAIIVGCHHPPYTNSAIVSPSEEVQHSFVPVFLRSRKCKLFVSGHSHAVEHFKVGGKDFLVIGGGGGLQHPLLPKGERRWNDLFPQENEKRMFHYLKCRVTATSLELSVQMLKADFSSFAGVYRVSIPYR